MEFVGATNVAAGFQNNAGDTSTLILDHAGSFSGTIAGLSNDGVNSDTLDLKSIIFASSASWTFTESASGNQGLLAVADTQGNTANLTLQGQYLAAGTSATSLTSSIFQLATDSGTGSLVTTTVKLS